MLEEVKKYLAITWNDEITNFQVQNSIDEGKAYLENIVGSPILFNSDLVAKSLLKDYCRYVRNYSLELFENNFKDRLISLQLKYAVFKEQNKA